MKIDIDNTLIRYGRLHLTKQKGFGNDTFHSPPAPIGFYAMPIRFQELFLVGSISSTQPKYYPMPKEKNTKELTDDELDKIYRKNKNRKIHKFTIKNTDNIWHHLDAKPNCVLDRYGSWVKTSVRDWKISLKKESLKLRAESLDDELFQSNNISEVRPKTGWFSKDNFEVFIDSKIY